MKHVNDERTHDDWPRCGSWDKEVDTLVVSALESDCESCRTSLLIGPPSQKGCAVTPTISYVPQPMEDAEELVAAAIRRRDGRE